jgi:hypothetical protein
MVWMVVYSDEAKGYASSTATNRASKARQSVAKENDKHLCRVKPTLLREQTLTENRVHPGWELCRRMATTLFKNTSFEENWLQIYYVQILQNKDNGLEMGPQQVKRPKP